MRLFILHLHLMPACRTYIACQKHSVEMMWHYLFVVTGIYFFFPSVQCNFKYLLAVWNSSFHREKIRNIFRTAVICHLHIYSEVFIVKPFIKNSQVKMSNCRQFSGKCDSKYPWKHNTRFFYITWHTMSKMKALLYPFAQEIFLGLFFLLC